MWKILRFTQDDTDTLVILNGRLETLRNSFNLQIPQGICTAIPNSSFLIPNF